MRRAHRDTIPRAFRSDYLWSWKHRTIGKFETMQRQGGGIGACTTWAPL